ncbi:MAG: hypothetical protein ACLR4Z_06440 [Butyricicoccaceae bacterium]
MRQALAIASTDCAAHRTKGVILEASGAAHAPRAHDLLFDFGFARGVMPRRAARSALRRAGAREIAVLSRVEQAHLLRRDRCWTRSTAPPTVWLFPRDRPCSCVRRRHLLVLALGRAT